MHVNDRTLPGGQACLLSTPGTIAWVNEPWLRNGSPLGVKMRVGDNYLAACIQAGNEHHPDIADLGRAVTRVLHGHAEFATHEFSISGGALDVAGSSTSQRCLVRAQALAIDGKRCALVSHEDVTKTRLDAAALQASEERYRQFFEASPDPVFLVSAEPGAVGRILDANTLAASSHGYSREELLTMHIGDLDVPDDAARVQERIDTLLREGNLQFKVTHRRRDGSTFPVEVSARTTTIGGQPCVVTFNRDISERQDFEDTLRQHQVRMDLAARASRVGFWDWDLQKQSMYFSPEWKAQIGYEEHEISNEVEEWRSRVHPDDVENVLSIVDNYIRGGHQQGEEYITEFRFRHKDGSYRWIYVRGEATRDEAGNAVRFVGCHVDITAQKQAEMERAMLTQRLSQMQRLEAMGTLAGGIAHDFNNILSIISGNVELALLETEDASIRSSLTEIQKASKRAGSLVRQILSFSRNEAPELRPVALSPIVAEAVHLIRSTAPQRITIHSDIAVSAVNVFADPEQLHQALVNLGTNACHAIGNGAGMVTFQLSCSTLPPHLSSNSFATGDGEYAVIEVSDDGIGMNEELRSRIFEPFFTTKPSGKGTGLGLSVVHGIVSNHGGTVDVASTPGSGTTFRVYLPKRMPTNSEPNHETRSLNGAGAHVLLVDDEPNLLSVLARGLRRLGFEVTAIENPLEAIETVRMHAERFDAFVTDFDMPGLNGIKTAEHVHQIRADLPILLYSGFLEEQLADDAMGAGILRILNKPLLAKDLAAAIHDVRPSQQ